MTSGARKCCIIELCTDFLTRLFARTTSTKVLNSLPKDMERTTSLSGDMSSLLWSPWRSFWLVCIMLHSCYSVMFWNYTNDTLIQLVAVVWKISSRVSSDISTLQVLVAIPLFLMKAKRNQQGFQWLATTTTASFSKMQSSCNSCSLCWKRAVLRYQIRQSHNLWKWFSILYCT